MSSWRAQAPRGLKTPACSTVTCSLLLLLTVLGFPGLARSQSGIRESRQSADEYDRTINRMKNDAKAISERRLNLFPQINEDFQRIQVIHNEIVRMIQSEKGLQYDRLAQLTDDMKKRTIRLRTNLILPVSETSEAETVHSEAVDEKHMKQSISKLHELIVSFVSNPLFKNLGVIDAKVVDDASENLDAIIDISDEIKREAKILSKSSKK